MCRDKLIDVIPKFDENVIQKLKKNEKVLKRIRQPYFSTKNVIDSHQDMKDKNAISYGLKSLVQSYEASDSIKYMDIAEIEDAIKEKGCENNHHQENIEFGNNRTKIHPV